MEENKNNEVTQNSTTNDDFVVIREQIKARPINKSKLAKNTFLVALSAVLFGLIASFTFIFLAPFVSGYFKNDSGVIPSNTFVIPEENREDEMLPEDMLINEPQPEIDYSQFNFLDESEVRSLVEGVVNQIEFSVVDYQKLYQKLSAIAYDFNKSLVRVSSVKTETDWMDNLVTNSSETTGLVVNKTMEYIYILTYANAINSKESIVVTFSNTFSAIAEFVDEDKNSGLCLLAVSSANLNEPTLNYVETPKFGGSKSNYLVGTPIIAVGNPMGTNGSVGYGVITSNGSMMNMTDCNYSYITTDIYGSTQAAGFVINLKGYVLGVIEPSFASKDMPNLVGIVGITELKKVIENMVNGVKVPYFGIKCVDVPTVAQLNYDVPVGAYVLSVEMGSPAMEAGIQKGDIISAINGHVILGYDDFFSYLCQLKASDTATVKVYRQSQDAYKEIDLNIILGDPR